VRKHRERLESIPAIPGTPPSSGSPRRSRSQITGAINAVRAPLTAAQAKSAEEMEIDGLMTNWALWRTLGGGPSAGESGSGLISSAYSLKARGRRSAVAMPLINGDAVMVDQAVRMLPALLLRVVYAQWLALIHDKRGHLKPWPHANVEQRARGCACSVRTYYRWLDDAHQRIVALIRARRSEATRAREQYRAQG
jgi:hypothetical protein